MEKYGDVIALKILAHEVWQGMTVEQLVDSWGNPADTDREIIKAKTKETWKYIQTGKLDSRIESTWRMACTQLEQPNVMLLTDKRTGALYCECHIKANLIVTLGTTDVPLDPDEQAEYRANREIVENAPAYGSGRVLYNLCS